MRNTIVVIISVLFLLNVMSIIVPIRTPSAANITIYVDDSNTMGPWNGTEEEPYKTVQEGINAAKPGDIIYVYNGTYNENITINKTITLRGETKTDTIIEGYTSGKNVLEIRANNVNVSGFTIKNAIGSDTKCIMMYKVQSCKITDNILTGSYDGIFLFSSNLNIVSENIITKNNMNGIFGYYADNNIIKENQITYNPNGITLSSPCDNNKISYNYIQGKQDIPQGIGISILPQCSDNIIYYNHFNDFDKNAEDSNTDNFWYNDSIKKGNYWDDYTGEDEDDDGIGDTPYYIPDGNNKDMYPLGYFAGKNNPPIAFIDSITPNPATYGQTVSFYGHGTDDGTIADWEWKSDKNGLISSLEDFSYSDLSEGTHTITFRVKDNDGKWSTPATRTLLINPYIKPNQKPTAQIITVNPNISLYGESIYFHGTGLDDDGVIIGCLWHSNIDGNLNYNLTFTKSNLSVGNHTIYFKVKDNVNEWSNEVSTKITVSINLSNQNNPPTADPGGPYSADINTSILFNGSNSYDVDGDHILSYLWDFGDGTTGLGENVEHIYNTTSNYTIKLTVTDKRGGVGTGSTYAKIIKPGDQNNNGNKNGVPGFEVLFIILAIVFILLRKKKK